MRTKRIYLSGLLLCAFSSCADYSIGIDRPKGRIPVGTSITPPLIDYGSAAYQKKSILPVYTFIRKVNQGASNLDDTSHHLYIAQARPNVSHVVASYGDPSKPSKMTVVSQSIEAILSFNASDGCAQKLNDLADVAKHYSGAVIICDKSFAEALQNATEVNVDGRTFTSWPRSSFDYDSARVVVHEF